MTKRIVTFAFLILITAHQAFSQETVERQIDKIRKVYGETNKRIADGLKDDTQGLHYAVWRVGGKGDGRQWAAVGTMETTDEIWFEEAEDGEDGSPAVIHKIVSIYKSAGVTHSRREYYFNEAGEPVFILASDDADSESGRLVERRFYYAAGKLIRVVSGGVNTDRNFSAAETEKSTTESRTAREMRRRYVALLDE